MAADQGQQLLPGEQVVTSNNVITLTNYRVFRDSAGGGQSRYISITLDAVSSCGLVTNSQPVLLVLGILAAIAGIGLKGDIQALLIVAGIVLVVMYFATRSAVVAICSSGGERITVPAQAQHRSVLMKLINAVDREKLVALGRIGTAHSAHAAPSIAPLPVAPRSSAPGTW